MLSMETIKWRLARTIGQEFPLVQWPGAARVLSVGEKTIALLVNGQRAEYTWERVRGTWERLVANHELSVRELGGQHDAAGLVALLAFAQAESVVASERHGVLRLAHPTGTPVHQPTAPRD